MHCCTGDEHLAQASENNVIDLLFTYTINVLKKHLVPVVHVCSWK